MDVKCNNCDWQGNENDLSLVAFDAKDENETPTAFETPDGAITKLAERPEAIDFLKGCPNCLTDGYLMDTEDNGD